MFHHQLPEQTHEEENFPNRLQNIQEGSTTEQVEEKRRKSRSFLTDIVEETRKFRRHSELTRPQPQNLSHTIFVNNNSKKERIHCYKTFNILVLGPKNVGKTSLVRRFVKGKFTDDYLPTISEEYETGVFLEIADKLKQFDLLFKDFGGDLRSSYPELYREEIMKADGFLVVHSRESPHSLAEVLEITVDIRKARQQYNILVAENKCDNSDNQLLSEFESMSRKPFQMEAGLLNESVSAKSNMNVEEAIALLVKKIEHNNKETLDSGTQISE